MHLVGRVAFIFLSGIGGPAWAGAPSADGIVSAALAAEAQLDSRTALELFLEADRARPNDSLILQKIAQQYSDLVVELTAEKEKKRYAEIALGYAERAVTLDPKNAVNVLSLAICYGKLATYSDTRTKVAYSKRVKEEAERAAALDPNYAWAHHVLGRWHYEVAGLGGAAKWFLRTIYGGLPVASTGESIKELTRAVQLDPGELAHRLELGFAYLADRQEAKARTEFTAGLAMPSRRKHDEAAKERARTALATIETRKR